MRLTPGQTTELQAAMERSFGPLEMQRLLKERFGLALHNLSSLFKGFSDQVFDIHRYFDHRNTAEELVAALRDSRPREPSFVALADQLGFTVLPTSDAFEVMVRKAGPAYQDAADFRSGLAQREHAVCRVELPTGYGTGALVGKRLVLTNHHVLGIALDAGGKLAVKVTCLFDHKKAAQGYTTPARRVEVLRVLASSPPAAEDYKSNQTATDPKRLDYALLELDQDVGDQPIVPGAEARGFLDIAQEPNTPALAEGLLILQHPLAKPMKIDIGSVTWLGGTRLRHSVNTDKGSSGAPMFDAALNLVALHHAGFDWPSADHPYNQAIPLALIVADCRAQNVQI